MKLWIRALPKRTRFHDLRHTTATLLLKEGVSMGVVQKVLRHSDITVTEGVYSHLDIEDVKKGLAKMPLTGVEELARTTPGYRPGRQAATEVAADFAAKSLTGNSKGRTSKGKPSKIRPFGKSGRQDLNLRPLGPEGSPRGSDTVGSGPMAADVPEIVADRSGERSDTDRPSRPGPALSVTFQAQDTLGTPRLLTVREVAERLRVCRATVYRLVAEGRIAAVRISSGAIRVPETGRLGQGE